VKTIIVYYSFTGHCKAQAEKTAKEMGVEAYEVRDAAKLNTFKAYTWGCFQALRHKKGKIEPLSIHLSRYAKIIVVGPVWAGNPAPAMNAIFEEIPAGKDVEVWMVSASGNSGAENHVRAVLEGRKCQLTAYKNIKG